MTDLTKDWKDGKLPSGWYWVECCRDKGIYAYTGEYLNNMYRPRNSERIIEKVPSYDEWQASENYIDYLKQCISVYESKDKQATETSIAYNELLEENTKLKELLKECIPYFNALVEKRLKLEYIPQVYELLSKINEVLK